LFDGFSRLKRRRRKSGLTCVETSSPANLSKLKAKTKGNILPARRRLTNP